MKRNENGDRNEDRQDKQATQTQGIPTKNASRTKSRKHPKAKSENPKNVQNRKHEYSETQMRTKPNPMSNVIVPNQEGLK